MREEAAKGATLSPPALDPDGAPVGFNNTLTNMEAQAKPAAKLPCLPLVKGVKHLRQVSLLYANPLVLDFHEGIRRSRQRFPVEGMWQVWLALIVAQPHLYGGALGGILYGVEHQVVQQPPYLHSICINRGMVRGNPNTKL